MIVARHRDGRILLMAAEYGLKPMIRNCTGEWVPSPPFTGYDLQEDFITVMGRARIQFLDECMNYIREHS